MRIVALHAVRRSEWLVLVGLLQARVFRIVALHTQRWGRLGEMEAVLRRRLGTCLVGDVAGVATHIERCMTAAFFRHIQSGLMATGAEVFLFTARGRLQELILVVAGVCIVAAEAVANRRGMHRTLDVSGFLIRMTGEAKRGGSRGDELYASDVLVDPDLMATQAARGHGRMNVLAFRLVLVALKALRGVRLLVQWNGVNLAQRARCQQPQEGHENPCAQACMAAVVGESVVEPDSKRDRLHTDSEESISRRGRIEAKKRPRRAKWAHAINRKTSSQVH